MAMRQSRDVQIHAAVTRMNRTRGVEVIGEKEVEIAQFAVQIDADFVPMKAEHLRVAFEGLYKHCLDKARAAGLMRAGE